MTSDASSAAHRELHELIDGLTEEQAEALLLELDTEDRWRPPLTEQQAREIKRRLDNPEHDDAISTDEMLRRFGIHDRDGSQDVSRPQ